MNDQHAAYFLPQSKKKVEMDARDILLRARKSGDLLKVRDGLEIHTSFTLEDVVRAKG